MNGLLIGDVFFREYLVQFDVSSPDKTVIGIGKLRHGYQPVKRLEQRRVMNEDESPQALAQTLHVLPAFKKPGRQLTRRAVTAAAASVPRQAATMALSSETLLDDMPVFNRHGTQYFVNVSIGSPLQHFTVIFDTGSAVFGVFIRNSDLPKSISFSHMRCVTVSLALTIGMLPFTHFALLSFARADVSKLSAIDATQQPHFHGVQKLPAADTPRSGRDAAQLAVAPSASSEPSWLTWTDVGVSRALRRSASQR
jgi:hypothetical protein